MNRLLFKKNFRESRWLLLGCTAAIFSFCWLRVWMVSQLATDRFKAILDMLPSDWRRFLSVDLEWLVTYPGRISLAYQELIVILCMALWCIARGSDAVSGELNRGSLEMLLAQPISRLRIYVSQSVVTMLGVMILAAAALGGTVAGILTTTVKEEISPTISLPFYLPAVGTELTLPFGKTTTVYTPMREKADWQLFVPATVNLFALGFMISGLTLFMSSWDRYRWRTIGITTAILVGQTMLKIAGMASEGTHWLKYLSLLSAYEPEVYVRLAHRTPASAWAFNLYDSQGNWTEFGPMAANCLLLGVGAICLLIGASIFMRRDLPAPM